MSEPTPGDAQATGMTEAQAAEAFEARLTAQEGGDSDGDEALQEDEESPEQAEGEEPEVEESDDDAEDAEEAEKQPALVTVKVNGVEEQVTLEEAIAGYQRQQDYSREKNAVAEERRALEPLKAELAAERERAKSLLTVLEQRLQEPTMSPEDLEWLRINEPLQYGVAVADEMRRTSQVQAAQAERQRLEAQTHAEMAAKQAETIQAEQAKLFAARPDWKDPVKQKAAEEAIRGYMTQVGFDPAELSVLTDHRLYLILDEAAKYRALKDKTPQVQKKVEAVKTAKPGVASQQPSKVTEVTRAKQRLAKTGNVHDAAAVFLQRMG